MKFNNYVKVSLITLISVSLISCTQSVSNTSNNVNTNQINKIDTSSLLTNTKQDEQKPSFLFVQESQSGSLVKNDNSEDIYTLTLENVSPSTNYFTDRPFRLTGDMKTSDLIEHWNGEGKNSFANEPPNAALSIIDDNGDSRVIVIELTNPSYDKASKKLSYNATILNDYENSNFKSLISNHMFNDELPAKFNSSTLFIDNLTEKLQNISNSKVNPILNVINKINTKLQSSIKTKLSDTIEKITTSTKALDSAQKEKDIGKALRISADVLAGLSAIIGLVGIIVGMIGLLTIIPLWTGVLAAILVPVAFIIFLEAGIVAAIAGALGVAGNVEEMKASNDENTKKQGLALESKLNELKNKQFSFNNAMVKLKSRQDEIKSK